MSPSRSYRRSDLSGVKNRNIAGLAPAGTPASIDTVEVTRQMLTVAVQNGLDMGWSLKETLQYLSIRGVAHEDIALVRREDLVFPTIGESTSESAIAGE